MKKKWLSVLPAFALFAALLSFQSADASSEMAAEPVAESEIPAAGYEAILNWPPEEQPIVKRGSHSFEVEFIQMMLGHFGFETEVDGIFGPHTDQQVRSLQAAYGLVSDGIVGVNTWTLLQEEYAAKRFQADIAIIIAEQHFDNEDLTFSSNGILYEDANGDTFYTLQAQSKKLMENGGSGTVGFYDVYFNGDIVESAAK
ncbi:peptidoglycan-binding domain-containing protein [Planococcus salinus]|uniref:Peptidoglycan-binding protein n=1 Tax=Planococcus salinus TaxID=1848460 RepID=A0A3M8P7G3_9BACL|nr:peptidoglycan-binding domain-containing protein [Planococcus salinus]RNF39587.1 peptidoglycan-binding protein [Planococcus salinus]